ncbi:MAG: hypothetical protein MUP61_06685 [Burkholderiales bacterium]|nr:hypothetical protein [Burkholderiales bacterium]MCJ7838880.1 hypothetical protein [Burkholderiales bacterium]
MDITRTLDQFTCPFGGQQIELVQVEYEAGGMPLLRVRIRERGARFTIFEIDPATAERWGQGMLAWSQTQAKT